MGDDSGGTGAGQQGYAGDDAAARTRAADGKGVQFVVEKIKGTPYSTAGSVRMAMQSAVASPGVLLPTKRFLYRAYLRGFQK
jgi:hypothetical protein